MSSIDTRQLRSALGAFTTGVTIVTTRDALGNPIGITVNSFNSVSLDPPLVLWSLARSSASLSAFIEAPYFAVHILSAQQEHLSNLFARRGADKFAGLELESGHGNVPLLGGCSARFQCRTAFRYDGGDHEIIVGEVITFELFDRLPLVYQGGKYALALKRAESTRNNTASDGADSDLDRHALNVLLGMAYHQLNVNLQPKLAGYSLTEEEYWILNMVGGEKVRTIARLDALIAFTGKRVTPTDVASLEERGYVQLRGEGAEAQVRVTDRGRRVLIELAAITKAIEEQAEGSLDYSEMQLLKQLLQRIIRSSLRHARAA